MSKIVPNFLGHCYWKDKLQVFQMFGKIIWTPNHNIIHRVFCVYFWRRWEFLKPTVCLEIVKYPSILAETEQFIAWTAGGGNVSLQAVSGGRRTIATVKQRWRPRLLCAAALQKSSVYSSFLLPFLPTKMQRATTTSVRPRLVVRT